MMPSPHIYYNAVALYVQNSYDRLAALFNEHHSWENAFRAISGATAHDPAEEYARLEKRGIRLILRTDEEFPPVLREIPGSPFGIYVQGPFLLEPPALAIVGTRRGTREGLRTAEYFAATLAERGVTIVSGLALGIDGAAHHGALSRNGKTIAVLPVGLDLVYPPSHAALAEHILSSGGSLVSEYALGTPALPYRFLERNRIVSGLSQATLVIEAPHGSGALVTARFALEQNRDVFAVPGSIAHPYSYGPHFLIQRGAALITSPEDLYVHLNLPDRSLPHASPLYTPEEQKILSCIAEGGGALSLDTIAALTTLGLPAINRTLTHLVIHGTLKEDGGRYTLA